MQIRPLYPKKQFCADFGINHSGFYRLVNSGALKAHKINGRVFVKGEEVERWLATLPELPVAA